MTAGSTVSGVDVCDWYGDFGDVPLPVGVETPIPATGSVSGGPQLLLEPNSEYPAMKALRESLVKDGIPYTAFEVKDIKAEHKRLEGLGVRFTMPPTEMGPTTEAIFDDTCGNLIQIFQKTS